MITEDANALCARGVELLELKKYDEAIKAFEKAIELKPDYAEAWTFKSSALFELEKYDEAIKAFEKAIELKPDYAEEWAELKPEYAGGWAAKGYVLLIVLERYEEAIKAFEKAIELKPDYAEAWAFKGVALIPLKRYEEAIKASEKAIELKPEYTAAWVIKGLTHLLLERYEEAIKALEKAIELKPEYAKAWYVKGFVLTMLERYEEAIKALEKSIELDPKNIGAHINLGELFFDLGNLKGSSKKVKELLEIDENNARALSLEGRIKIENKDYYGAAESFEKAISLNKGDPLLFLWDVYANYLNIEFSKSQKVAEPYQEKENIALVMRKLERAKKLSNKHGEEETRAYILYFLGYFYYKIHDIFTAKEKLEECVKLESTIKKPARELLESIWNFQIRPNLIEWWLFSPTYSWSRRIIFSGLLASIFLLFLYPMFINPEFKTNWKLYYSSIIILFLILIHPYISRISRVKAKEFEIEIQSPPPFEFVLSPPTMEIMLENLKTHPM